MDVTDLRAVIFDFDYTLADSSRGAHDCINFALQEMGLNPVDADAACRTIGFSLAETFLMLGKHHQAARCAEFHQLFIKRAEEVMVNMTVLYKSVPATTEALSKRGLKLGIVSTKYRRRINEVLEREGLLGRFAVVIGGDDVKEHKPDPEGLLRAIERLECSPASVVYVGDSEVDAKLAQRAEVGLVVVLSGVTPRQKFDNYETLAVLEDLGELPDVLV